ncbi:pseudouridine synthase [Treponema sp.]|uniref:pseudouridine synthase n=1 Tax=Treponema sp. TaxID=166 RepID=UPI00388FAF58
MMKAKERLDKILANSGFGTRRDVKRLVRYGEVLINGERIRDPEFHIDVDNDKVVINGEPLEIEKHSYFMMNKAGGAVCSTKSDRHQTVYEFLDEKDNQKRLGGSLSTVGRLDADTEGLLIFTTDGELNHRLTFPKYEVKKTYLVHLRDSVSDAEKATYIERAKSGLRIPAAANDPECDAKPCDIEFIEDAKCTITVTEGRFHEVKRIFIALGNEVVYLKRLMMGTLHLDESLGRGEYRTLTDEELFSLKELVK